MFSTIRARLWLTYAILVGAVLGIVLIGLMIYAIQNPLVDRQALLRLQVLAGELKDRAQLFGVELPEERINLGIVRFSEQYGVRVLYFDAASSLRFDTGGQNDAELIFVRRLLSKESGVVRDSQRNWWIYTRQKLPDGGELILASLRPARLSLVARLFGDNLLTPFIQAALVAVVLSLILGAAFARWVAAPLQKISSAAEKLANIETMTALPPVVPDEGPKEVKILAHSFNQMAEQVFNSQRSQKEFVANVSHELKTPLTSIQGFAGAILDGTAGTPETLRRAAEVIRVESSRMHHLVLDLLELARFDARTVELNLSALELKDLLDLVVQKFEPQARQLHVTIQLEAGNLPKIRGDGDRLVQVFSNLLDNALKHSPPESTVTVQCVSEVGWVVINFIDHGEGIPEEDLPRVFERFYQVDKSRGIRHGTGLGLPIAKEIVQAHGGLLDVSSQVGVGSCFVVKLPA